MFSDSTFENKLREFQSLVVKKQLEITPELAALNKIGQGFENKEAVELSKTLIKEETNELLEALDEGDKAHILKEACDVIYVVVRMCIVHGLKFGVAFNRVHANNMLKFETGTIRPDGKLVKDQFHPKVRLGDLI